MASAGQDEESPRAAADGGRGQRVRHGIEAAKGKYAGSSAEHLWRRLDAMDFINRGMLFAATLLLCFFPFLIVANALAGRSAASGLARHLGLNQQAAADVGGLFTSSAATSSAVTGTAWVFFILGGIAAAAAIPARQQIPVPLGEVISHLPTVEATAPHITTSATLPAGPLLPGEVPDGA